MIVKRHLHATALRNILSEGRKLLRRKGQERWLGQQMKAVTLLTTPNLRTAAVVLS